MLWEGFPSHLECLDSLGWCRLALGSVRPCWSDSPGVYYLVFMSWLIYTCLHFVYSPFLLWGPVWFSPLGVAWYVHPWNCSIGFSNLVFPNLVCRDPQSPWFCTLLPPQIPDWFWILHAFFPVAMCLQPRSPGMQEPFAADALACLALCLLKLDLSSEACGTSKCCSSIFTKWFLSLTGILPLPILKGECVLTQHPVPVSSNPSSMRTWCFCFLVMFRTLCCCVHII